MSKITIISVGKIKEAYIKDGIEEFSKRLSKFTNINEVVVKEEKHDSSLCLKMEEEKIISQMSKCDFNIIMDIDGNQYSSTKFAECIEKIFVNGNNNIGFVIGSSHGLSNKVKDKGDLRMSISKMTFPHQIFKLILIEQIYRAFKILANEKYHK